MSDTCECGFVPDACAANLCLRKKTHLAGLLPGSNWPNTGSAGNATETTGDGTGNGRTTKPELTGSPSGTPQGAGNFSERWALEKASAILSLAAQPPAAPVETAHMTYNTIKAAFDEFRKTVTVVEEKPNFNSFSQGYVAGWNAKEAAQCSSAGTGEAWNPTDEQVRSACMWYRHDMGLLTVSEAAAVKTEARLWLRAWQKEIAGIRAVPQSLWQPIETAPQDGTRILATGGGLGKEVEAVTYNERVGCWSAETCTLDDTDHEPDGYNRPTHWQPMPDASALSRPQLEAGSTELPSHQGKAP
jgi:hypothetical protein